MQGAVLQDVTRLFSRRFRDFDTGIDRVERGVFEELAKSEQNRFLVRSGDFYFQLTAPAFRQILSAPAKGRLAGYWQLYHLSEARGIKRFSPQGFDHFLHLGHIHHGMRFWENLKNTPVKITILIHDVIPLDYPETTRDDQVDKFRVKFERWMRYGDQILTQSAYNQSRILDHAQPNAPIKTIPLAVNPIPKLDPPSATNPANAFLTLGTIEPRKNHALLLKVWEELAHDLGADCPHLWIIGARGWKNTKVFDFLDNSPLMNQVIFELGALDDRTMQSYFSRARALLFPSRVEGFGLPFFEAILSEQKLIASDIPIFREFLSQKSQSQLFDCDDVEGWKNAILNPPKQALTLKKRPLVDWGEYVSRIV